MNNLTDKRLDDFLKGYALPSTNSKEDAWEKLNANIHQPALKSRRSIGFYIYTASAAAVLFLFLSLFNIFDLKPRISIVAKNHETIQLPEGSTVELNPGSVFTFSKKTLNRNRIANLKGEAFFNVQKGKPFSVEIQNGKVEVLGTSFLVSAYNENYQFIECLTGKVKVQLCDSTIILAPNQGVKCYKTTNYQTYQVQSQIIKERSKGVYLWSECLLSEILDVYKYRHNINVFVPESVKNRKFSGKLDMNNLETGLKIVSLAMDLNYKIDVEKKELIIEDISDQQ